MINAISIMPAKTTRSSPGLGNEGRKLISKIAAAKKEADAAKKEAQAAKDIARRARKKFKEAKRKAKELRKIAKALKQELEELAARKAAAVPKRTKSSTAKNAVVQAPAIVETLPEDEPLSATESAPPMEIPAAVSSGEPVA
jgi:chromosome segregation ATPase